MESSEFNNAIDEFKEALRGASSIVLFTHVHPDADAYGSISGLRLALSSSGADVLFDGAGERKFYCVNSEGDAEHLAFVPGTDQVLKSPPDGIAPDLIIVCDCGELSRVGGELEGWVNSQNCPIVNIDHHATNNRFGTINFVDSSYSSTAEFLVAILESLGVQIGKEIAQCLLGGIVGDTGGFRYRSATADTLTRAASLVRAGACLPTVNENLFGSVPLSTVRFESFALQNLRLLVDGRLAGAVITPEDYERLEIESLDGENLTEKIRDIKGVEVAYTIRWRDGAWKVSLRTSNPDYDLASVAKSFGGGGHKAAAAFRFSEPVDVVLPQLEGKLEAVLR